MSRPWWTMEAPPVPQQTTIDPRPSGGGGGGGGGGHSGGSIGMLVVVLAAITILGVLAGAVARICGGRHLTGAGGDYDFEGWIENKCSTCIDGSLGGGASHPPSKAGDSPPPKNAPAGDEEEKKDGDGEKSPDPKS